MPPKMATAEGTHSYCNALLLPSAMKLRRLFCLHLSRGGLPHCMLGYDPTPWEHTAPGPGTPQDQVPPRPRQPTDIL